MPLAQDRSLELLASSPVRYHYTTDAPSIAMETITCDDYGKITTTLISEEIMK